MWQYNRRNLGPTDWRRLQCECLSLFYSRAQAARNCVNNNNNNNNNNNLRYKDLTIEIQRMWSVKTKVVPVIIGTTGTISKSFRKYVSNRKPQS
jgi:hypothetical protein